MSSSFSAFLISIYLISCSGKSDTKETVNAKWYFYAFALEGDGYDKDGKVVDPLTYDIMLKGKVDIVGDTATYYFSLYQNDTLNVCTLKPYGLVAVEVIRGELFIPLYHGAIFEESAELIKHRMKKQNELLLHRTWKEGSISHWLEDESLKRR